VTAFSAAPCKTGTPAYNLFQSIEKMYRYFYKVFLRQDGKNTAKPTSTPLKYGQFPTYFVSFIVGLLHQQLQAERNAVSMRQPPQADRR